MAEQTKKIRDFIYLDGDKLYSLYSQVNEGLANQIIQSRSRGEEQNKTQAGGVGEGAENAAKFSDLIESTESKVLHDYMYAKLEEQIEDSIIDSTTISYDQYQDELKNSFLVKVKGEAEIADYGRLKHIFDNINELGQGIAYIQDFPALGMHLHELKRVIDSTKNKEDKRAYQQLLERYEKPELLAKEKGLHQDQRQMGFFGFFTEMFYSGEIEVTLKLKDGDNEINFRGILNKDWLRLKPEALRMLYAGRTSFDWTMIAQITYLPSPEKPAQSVAAIIDESKAVENNGDLEDVIDPAEAPKTDDTMRDALLRMARATRDIENSFMVSGLKSEVVVSPLAIYRETEIKVKT